MNVEKEENKRGCLRLDFFLQLQEGSHRPPTDNAFARAPACAQASTESKCYTHKKKKTELSTHHLSAPAPPSTPPHACAAAAPPADASMMPTVTACAVTRHRIMDWDSFWLPCDWEKGEKRG